MQTSYIGDSAGDNVKLTSLFSDFLRDTVNLNADRLTLLSDSVSALKTFIRKSNWEPHIRTFQRQGSWGHQTIIKPVDGKEYDADLLAIVDPVEGWEAADYVKKLGEVFKASSVYKDKTTVYDYCVTITYSGVRKVDITPCVVDRWLNGYEVCNSKTNKFEQSTPLEYTTWMVERNNYSGSNSFRKVTRLLKYMRDIKTSFSCRSVLFTTLIGSHIDWPDRGSSNFSDTPTALKTVIGRLDDWLQVRSLKPAVPNPTLSAEDFSRLWETDAQYENFRNCINRYRRWIDEAYDEEDRTSSIKLWQKVFGEEFGKGANVQAAVKESTSKMADLLGSVRAYTQDWVDQVKSLGVSILPASFMSPPYMEPPKWPTTGEVPKIIRVSARLHSSKDSYSSNVVFSGDSVSRSGGLWFEASQLDGSAIPDGYKVHWRIVNTGSFAISAKATRGDFYSSDQPCRRYEGLQYRGVHWSEAFVIRTSDNHLVAQSEPFYVVIE